MPDREDVRGRGHPLRPWRHRRDLAVHRDLQRQAMACLMGGYARRLARPLSGVAQHCFVRVGQFLRRGRGIRDPLGTPLFLTWNGHIWTKDTIPPLPKNVPIPPGATVPVPDAYENAVSCPTSNFCAAIGTMHDGQRTPATIYLWNGSTWKLTETGAYLLTVSCARTRVCTALGTAPRETGRRLPRIRNQLAS